MKLSICIMSMWHRRHELDALLTSLDSQARSMPVEVLIALDNGRTPPGIKRNQLVAGALGEYLCFVDDDDEVHALYIEKVMDALLANPGVDAVAIRGRRITRWTPDEYVDFDFRLGSSETTTVRGTVWRSPGPLCPIRTELVRAVPFTAEPGEDLRWCEAMSERLCTLARAAEFPLYLYRFDPNK
jgi:hypothetical protein